MAGQTWGFSSFPLFPSRSRSRNADQEASIIGSRTASFAAILVSMGIAMM